MVKRALDKSEKRWEQQYPLYSDAGVLALLNSLHSFEALMVARGDYDALIMLLDLERAIRECGLSYGQQRSIALVFFRDFTPKEVAVKLGVSERRVGQHIQAAASKISQHLQETEGYRHE